MQFIFFSCGNADATDECWGSLLALDCIVWGRQVFFFWEGGRWSERDAKRGTVSSWSPRLELESTMRRKGLDAMWRRCSLLASSRATLSTLRLSSSLVHRFTDREVDRWFWHQGCGGRCLSLVF